jgi:hypothetical protein
MILRDIADCFRDSVNDGLPQTRLLDSGKVPGYGCSDAALHTQSSRTKKLTTIS